MFFDFAQFSQIIKLFMVKLLSAIFINISMQCENSNSLEPSDKKTPEFYISKLFSLQKRLQIIINQLKMPLNYIFPSNFEEKYEEAKNYDQIDAYWIQNYKEIIAFIIEGQMNTTLMRLGEKFRHQFGGHTMFWMDLICSFAQNEKYEENFRIWQVIDTYKHCLHLQKGEYEKNRKFRRLTKFDIQVTKKLISSIYELRNLPQSEMNSKNVEEIMVKVESNYSNHVESNRKIVDFLRSEEHKNINLDFFESYGSIFQSKKENSNYSNSRTKKSQKQKERQHNILKQRMITDFSVNFREDKNSSLLRKIVGKNQRSQSQLRQKKDAVEQSYKNLAQNSQNIDNLRQQLLESKSKLLKKLQPSINNISISYSYLTYNNFYITPERQSEFHLAKPFEEYPDINYDNNDYEEYEEYQAEELEGVSSQVMTDDESLESCEKEQLYEEENPYEMDSEDQEVFVKAIRNQKLFFGKSWVLNLKNQNPIKFTENESTPNKGTVQNQMIQEFFNHSNTICPYFTQFPLQIQLHQFQDPRTSTELSEQQIEILKNIVHLKSYAQVIEIIEQDESLADRFPKLKLHKFIEKNTRKVKKRIDGKKVHIYHVIDPESKRQTRASSIQLKKVVEIDQSRSMASQITQLEQPDFHQVKIQLKGAGKSNLQKPNSQSLPNKHTLRNSKRTKKMQRKLETLHTDASQTLSMRLRSRPSKPIYNIDSLLGIVPKKRSKQQDNDEDFEI